MKNYRKHQECCHTVALINLLMHFSQETVNVRLKIVVLKFYRLFSTSIILNLFSNHTRKYNIIQYATLLWLPALPMTTWPASYATNGMCTLARKITSFRQSEYCALGLPWARVSGNTFSVKRIYEQWDMRQTRLNLHF